MNGYTRVTNKRRDMDPDGQPEPDETVIPVDRTHHCLGNPFILANKNDSARRAGVIKQYREHLEKDWVRRGPMFKAIGDIAKRVLAGEKICLQCHCKPLPCHAEAIQEKVNLLVANPSLIDTAAPETHIPKRPRF